MRVIEFRAWVFGGLDDDAKPFMTTVTAIQWDNFGNGPEWSIKWVDHEEWSTQDECHLIQFTGLKDKNGRDIYEGDLVDFEYGAGRVFWDNTTASFKIEFDTDTDDLWLYCCTGSVLEIIGNIHENPELLEANNGRTSEV